MSEVSLSPSKSSRSSRSAVDPATVLTSVGVLCVVLGGLVSAVTAPLELAHGSWAAAYLVLVGGVAQCAMGLSRARHPDAVQSPSWAWGQIAAWNLGNVVVIGGTLVGEPWMVDVGSVLLVIALAIALHATRSVPALAAQSPAHSTRPSVPAWVEQGYRLLLLVMATSIPIGIVLAHIRHS